MCAAAAAHKRGKAYTVLLFDPYQIKTHGSGVCGNICCESNYVKRFSKGLL